MAVFNMARHARIRNQGIERQVSEWYSSLDGGEQEQVAGGGLSDPLDCLPHENRNNVYEAYHLEKEIFEYLDGLRESGATNMFGARPYIIENFDVNAKRAAKYLTKWMKTFSARHPPQGVAT